MELLAYIIAGFGVGFIVGLTGVGGGSLMTPILIFFFGIKPHLAIGTDLLFAAITKMSGSVQLARKREIDWKIVIQLSMGSVPAVLLTLYALKQMGSTSPEVQHMMTTTLGVALVLTAIATLYKAVFGQNNPKTLDANTLEKAIHTRYPVLPVLFGAFIGCLVTLTSVGAGAIGTYVGGSLLFSGHQVTFLEQPLNLDWIATRVRQNYALINEGERCYQYLA